MPVRRKELELSVERPLGGASATDSVVRLTARFETNPSGSGPTLEELRSAMNDLVGEIDRLVGPSARSASAQRIDRGLAELVDTYRPRQRELIDLLREEGEITDGEHALLAAHLPPTSPPRSPVPAPPVESRPSAPPPPAPVPAERGLPAARPVPELLRVYQITTLRQAGAVRARRQISFAEYMALKRHFEASDGAAAEAEPASRPA